MSDNDEPTEDQMLDEDIRLQEDYIDEDSEPEGEDA